MLTTLEERKKNLLRYGTVLDIKDYEDESGAMRYYRVRDRRGAVYQIKMHNGEVLDIYNASR